MPGSSFMKTVHYMLQPPKKTKKKLLCSWDFIMTEQQLELISIKRLKKPYMALREATSSE